MSYWAKLREQTSGLVRQRFQFTRSDSSSGLSPEFIHAKKAMRELRSALDELEAARGNQAKSGESHDHSHEQCGLELVPSEVISTTPQGLGAGPAGVVGEE